MLSNSFDSLLHTHSDVNNDPLAASMAVRSGLWPGMAGYVYVSINTPSGLMAIFRPLLVSYRR